MTDAEYAREQEARKKLEAAGGYAYPLPPQHSGYALHAGMTLRDWFAGQALAGLLAFSPDGCDVDGQIDPPYAADVAYTYADAMLAVRNRRE